MEQKEQEELKKGEVFMEKVKKFFQSLASDKVKCMYVIVLLLQSIFIILQFVPILYCTTSASETKLFGQVLDVELTNEKMSIYSFLCESAGTTLIFWGLFIIFAFSVKNLIFYFIKKDGKRYTGLHLSKIGGFFCLGLYFIFSTEMESAATKYRDYGGVCQKLVGGSWYVWIGIALLITSFTLSVFVKERKEKEKIAAKVQEELKKEKEQENA